MRASGLSTSSKDQIAERGARMARRDDRGYREYLREEQRSQPGCPAREVVRDRRGPATGRWAIVVLLVSGLGRTIAAQQLPELTEPVNDFAKVIDSKNAAAIDRMSRALKEKTGDVVVIVTAPTLEPYADINEYSVKLFEYHGRG